MSYIESKPDEPSSFFQANWNPHLEKMTKEEAIKMLEKVDPFCGSENMRWLKDQLLYISAGVDLGDETSADYSIRPPEASGERHGSKDASNPSGHPAPEIESSEERIC